MIDTQDLNTREIKVDDYKEISRIRKMKGVIENLLAVPDEPEEKIKNLIINKTENDYWYVAEIDNKVVGVGMLSRSGNKRKNHSGSITMMVDSDYHSMGIGNCLMKKIMDVSSNIGLKRVELTVFKDNTKAINLYKKYGFVEEGTKRKSALRNNEYGDELIMARVEE